MANFSQVTCLGLVLKFSNRKHSFSKHPSQSNFKEDRVIPQVEKSSQVDDWQESCDLPRGWMSKEKQQNFLEDSVICQAEHFIHEDGWQDSCKLISGWRSPVGHKKQSILEGERQVLDKQQQQTTKKHTNLRNSGLS